MLLVALPFTISVLFFVWWFKANDTCLACCN